MERFEALGIPLPQIDDQRRHVQFLEAAAGRATTAIERLESRGPRAFLDRLPGLIRSALEDQAADQVRVCEVADFVSDTVHPGDDPAPADVFVGLQYVESHTGRRIGHDPLSGLKGRKFRFQPGDILYGYLRPYLNKVWMADRDGLCSVDQYVLRPRPGVSSELLAYALRSRRVLDQAIGLTHSLQLPRLRSGLLADLTIPVARDTEVDELIARLDQIRDRVVDAAALRCRQGALAAALIPSALNEAFADLS